MLPGWLIIAASFAYLLLLFAVAYFGDRRADQGRSVIANPWVFSLSLAVYCTAWTYFGSVGRAASGGTWFLPTYLGPTLGLALAWLVVLKMIRIARSYRITSIADFIAARYGKSQRLAMVISLIAVMGILPYLVLQLKAIVTGLDLLMANSTGVSPTSNMAELALGVTLLLALFSILFGTRNLDVTEHHRGMVLAVALESLVKLLAFLAGTFGVAKSQVSLESGELNRQKRVRIRAPRRTSSTRKSSSPAPPPSMAKRKCSAATAPFYPCRRRACAWWRTGRR